MNNAAAEQPEQAQDEHVLGPILERAKQIKSRRDELKREFDIQDALFKEIKYEIINALDYHGTMSTKVDGVATASITKKIVANTSDWSLVHAYILENEMPELLQKRVNQGAYKELRDRGIEIPGLEDFEAVDLHLRVIND